MINQVSHYSVINKEMEAFRHLLSPKKKFAWSNELEVDFKSRERIVELVKNGVAIFQPNKTTIINTDWRMVGFGYWMYQKTCDCTFDPIPNRCCAEGWRVTLAAQGQ